MFKKNKIFYPENIYRIDFDRIKKSLAFQKYKFKDYGSIVMIKDKNSIISINNIGKIQIFYDVISENDLQNYARNFEKVFKKQINDFCIQI